jgi:diadenosine tetraphosphate (Ap4A) HIT family hydrolase
VYVVYFFESAFQVPQEDPPYHLHVHLIPRFASLDKAGRLQRFKDGTRWVDGWWIPCLHERNAIPDEYRPGSSRWAPQTEQLLKYLRDKVGSD